MNNSSDFRKRARAATTVIHAPEPTPYYNRRTMMWLGWPPPIQPGQHGMPMPTAPPPPAAPAPSSKATASSITKTSTRPAVKPASAVKSTTSSYNHFSCICRTPEICREISTRWAKEVGVTEYSKFVQLPRRSLMDVIDDDAQVGKHVLAYRRAALQSLGYTTNDDEEYAFRQGRVGMGVIDRISVVHIHPSVIPILILQEEAEEEEEGEWQNRQKLHKSRTGNVGFGNIVDNLSSSGRICKLDKWRLPYAFGQNLGMAEDSFSPTPDSYGNITFVALPNYDLNNATNDVTSAITTKNWIDQQHSGSKTSSMTTMTNQTTTMATNNNPILHHIDHGGGGIRNGTALFSPNDSAPTTEQMKHDNARLMKMYIDLAHRYEQEVKARTAYEQLAKVLQINLDTVTSLLNTNNNIKQATELVSNGHVRGHAITPKATTNTNTTATATISPWIDVNSGEEVGAVAELLELIHNGTLVAN